MSFREKLRKLLGIDENTTTHKIIISSLSEENDKKSIVKFIQENTQIIPCEYTVNELISKGYKKVQSQVGPTLGQLPTFANSVVSSSSYQIRFPEGFTVNDLMRLNRNNELTTIIKKGGKGAIQGQASLISNAPASAILGVFTVLSVVTSQYFLKDINNNLNDIKTRIMDIDFYIKEEKRSDIIADISFLDEAQRDYEYISTNPAYQQAMLTNILSIKKKASSNISFYSTMIKRGLERFETTKNKKYEITNALLDISENINNLKSSITVYMYSTIMQIIYSQNVGNSDYIDNIYSDANRNKDIFESVLSTSLDTYWNKMNEITRKHKIFFIEYDAGVGYAIKKGKFDIAQYFDPVAVEADKKTFCRSFLDSISQIKNLNNAQYVVCDDDLYMYIE